MAIESTPPLWVNALFPKQRLERVRDTRILHTTERDVRVKYSDNVLDTALLQREALWLSRVESLGVDTHQCLNFFKDGHRGVLKTTYLEGKSLSSMRRDIPTLLNKKALIREILSNLISETEQLHSVGVVHGDIKPANIIISSKGKLSLIDFSNARRMGDQWLERGVSQSTLSFAYPRNDKLASSNHDYYAILVTISSLFDESTRPLYTDFKCWTQLLINNLNKLHSSSFVKERVLAYVKTISEDLEKQSSS